MPIYSNKISVQIIGELLQQFAIQNIIISPGSRNAPFIIHFTQDNYFTCHSIVDERSAAFVALGMAQQLQKPVVICCTSGSAAANYYPAITEAFYQNIPIIILTADRPEKFIDQFDGQTIRQKNIFEKHSYGNFQLCEGESEEDITDNFSICKKAFIACIHAQGPIHINVPFSEPLYKQINKTLFTINTLTLPVKKYITPNYIQLAEKWNQSSKKLILCGLLHKNNGLQSLLEKINTDPSVVILSETTSNLSHKNFFSEIDKLIFSFNENDFEEFKPDLLFTIGQNVVSKKIKYILRLNKPNFHFHLDEYWQPDTYFCLTDKILYPKASFLKEFIPHLKPHPSNYFTKWNSLRISKNIPCQNYLQKIQYSDLKVFEFLSKHLPKDSQIHFSNSSAIRYSQLFDFNTNFKVYGNRGVSGIDGCTSTALGAAMVYNKQTFLVTGDLGFFYDSNALWNNYIPKNFKIIIINNGGGNIFKIIPGPDSCEALETFFETKHTRNVKLLAEMYQFAYFYANDFNSLTNLLSDFLLKNDKSILEINTKDCNNSEILRNFFKI